MKKIIIVLIILLSGLLSFYIYSTTAERKTVRPLTVENMARGGKSENSAKNPYVSMQGSSIPEVEIKEIAAAEEGRGKPSGAIIHIERSAIKAEDKLKDIPAAEEMKESGIQPAAFIAEAPPWGIKEIKEVKPEGKAISGQKTSLSSEASSEKAGKITGDVTAEKVVSKPADKPAPLQSESPLFVMKEGEKGTKDIVSERKSKQPQAETEPVAAVSPSEKPAETKEGIPAAGETGEYMEKPELFPADILPKGNNHRVAIFPFENLSDSRDAIKHVLPLLIDKLGEKGYEVVDDDEISSFLCKERVRTTGYVSREIAEKIRRRFNISAILTGAIVSFSTDEIPQFGILARMIDPSDGTIVWADYSAATGEDFLAILELGRLKSVYSLMPKVIDALFASFKVEELYRDIKSLHRIAVMPFKNNTGFNNAGIIATYMFTVELLKSNIFMPIEYGDVRETIIKLGIRHKGDIGYYNIGGLSKALNARGILVGVVDSYSDGAAVSAASKVGITARLVDGSNNKIIWYNSIEFSGEDNVIALDWGRIRSVHSVAYKAVSGLVKEMSKKKWRD